MAETGTVLAAREGVVDVRMVRSDRCENCTACSAVKDDMVLRDVCDPFGSRPGDTVEVGFDAGARPLLLAIAYLVPVAGLAGGYAAGYFVGATVGGGRDAAGALGAMAGVVAGLVVARAGLRRVGVREGMRPRLRAIIARGLTQAEGGPPPGGSCDEAGGTDK